MRKVSLNDEIRFWVRVRKPVWFEVKELRLKVKGLKTNDLTLNLNGHLNLNLKTIDGGPLESI